MLLEIEVPARRRDCELEIEVSARQRDNKLEVKEAAEHRRDSGVAHLLAIEEELDACAWSREKASGVRRTGGRACGGQAGGRAARAGGRRAGSREATRQACAGAVLPLPAAARTWLWSSGPGVEDAGAAAGAGDGIVLLEIFLVEAELLVEAERAPARGGGGDPSRAYGGGVRRCSDGHGEVRPGMAGDGRRRPWKQAILDFRFKDSSGKE
jgi:hypothetical protein